MSYIKNKLKTLYTDDRALRFLIAMLVFGIAAGVFIGVLNNYLNEILKINRLERGIVEFPRELPGLLLILIVGLVAGICEVRLLRIAMVAGLIGVIGIIFFGNMLPLAIIMIVLWSSSEHIMMPVRRSISIHMAQPGKEGLAMGAVGSLGNVGILIGNYLVPVIFLVYAWFNPQYNLFDRYRASFAVVTVVLGAGLAVAFAIPKTDMHVKRQRLYFRKKYTKYYILEMFFGARKQVFITFAPYVLIKKYGMPVESMGLLYGIGATINIYAATAVGRIIDRLGYRIVIIVETILLTLLCVIYGFSHHVFPHLTAFVVVCCVFVVDAILFSVAMARTMYVKSISGSQEEVTATLSTGISINHLISIIIAIGGGIIWQTLGVETLFIVAAAFGMGSFLFSLTLPKHTGREA